MNALQYYFIPTYEETFTFIVKPLEEREETSPLMAEDKNDQTSRLNTSISDKL
jgi:vacuolar-type H+-ATPase subunit D/Vma8